MNAIEQAEQTLREAQHAEQDFVTDAERIANAVKSAAGALHDAQMMEREQVMHGYIEQCEEVLAVLNAIYGELTHAVNRLDLPGFIDSWERAKEQRAILDNLLDNAMRAAPNRLECLNKVDTGRSPGSLVWELAGQASEENKPAVMGMGYAVLGELPNGNPNFDAMKWSRNFYSEKYRNFM